MVNADTINYFYFNSIIGHFFFRALLSIYKVHKYPTIIY